MLYYRKRGAAHSERPIDLDGYDGTINSQQRGEYREIGACLPMFFRPPMDGWRSGPGDWQVAQAGPLSPKDLLRTDACGFDVSISVVDRDRREWSIPLVLMPDGSRAFSAPLGADWTPEPTKTQRDLEECAIRFRQAMDGGAAIPRPAVCAWAATALCVRYHLSVPTIQALQLFDDAFVTAIMQAMAGRS